MASTPWSFETLTLSLPPGPIRAGIVRHQSGHCVVNFVSSNGNTLLQVGDVVLSLNGIRLAGVEGGPGAWEMLFQAFAMSARSLVVLRRVSHPTSAASAIAPTNAASFPVSSGTAASVSASAAAATSKAATSLPRSSAAATAASSSMAAVSRPSQRFTASRWDSGGYRGPTLSALPRRSLADVFERIQQDGVAMPSGAPVAARANHIEVAGGAKGSTTGVIVGGGGRYELAKKPTAAAAIAANAAAPQPANAATTQEGSGAAEPGSGEFDSAAGLVQFNPELMSKNAENADAGENVAAMPSSAPGNFSVGNGSTTVSAAAPAAKSSRSGLKHGMTNASLGAAKKPKSNENAGKPPSSLMNASKSLNGEQRDGPATNEVISLLSDEDCCDGVRVAARCSADGGGKMSADENNPHNEQPESEVMEVPKITASSSFGSKDGLQEDEELAIVATTGHNALADFPHSRSNCVIHPFLPGDKAAHCDNCYCYVCDIPANDCKTWASHCNATHDERFWRRERENAKRQARQMALAPTTSSSSQSAPTIATSRRTDFSLMALLQSITTIHPVEMQPPAHSGFTTSLRHYQKQSLAFMVETERTSNRGGWLCDEVGMGKSAVVLALVASNPPSPNTLASQEQINNLVEILDANEKIRQRIHKAHATEVEKIHSIVMRLRNSAEKNNGAVSAENWQDILAQEQNAIEASRQRRNRRLDAELIRFTNGRLKVKPTVIFTSKSLMGQWVDEAERHCPGLVVKTYHQSRKSDRSTNIKLDHKTIRAINQIDVIISTSTFSWLHHGSFEFHRVVQDESHLLVQNQSAKRDRANEIVSPLRWGVTATPASNADTSNLTRQLEFIKGRGNAVASNDFGPLDYAIRAFEIYQSESYFNTLADVLQTFMVRHTKAQRIGGAEALALPPSTTTTILLNMSSEEDRAFNHINCLQATFKGHEVNGAKRFTAEKDFVPEMQSVLFTCDTSLVERVGGKLVYNPDRLTKVVALRRDLRENIRSDPKLRAVVFTQHVQVHSACLRGLERDGFDVYEFTGSDSSLKRDAAIRNFQNTASGRPAVFVITLRSGNVGITLTAASRVYLLEPALDPTVEVQAAGRIHRLGQDKPCQVVRFAFRNSYEENVIELHQKISTGQVSVIGGFFPPAAIKLLGRGLRFTTKYDD